MTDQTPTILELRDIHRKFGSLEVLRGLSLTVNEGDICGFLGRNGAGKSTAIRIMLGIMQADRGDVTVFGQSIKRHLVTIRQRTGYVSQTQNFYPWMTAGTLAGFVSGFYPDWDQSLFDRLLRDFGLPEDRKVGNFSGGMKAKLALNLALSTRPQLLILDEPTAGMDAVARREFLTLVKRQVEHSGTTVFFSTHHIDDVEAAAQTICMIENGQALYCGSLQHYLDTIVGFTATIDAAIENPQPLQSAILDNAELLGVNEHQDRRTVIYRFDNPSISHDLRAGNVGSPVAPGWTVQQVSLEDIFVALVTRPDVSSSKVDSLSVQTSATS